MSRTLTSLVDPSPLSARVRMAGALAHLAANRDPHVRPLRRALRTALLGRVQDTERAWVTRIEAQRRELLTDNARAAGPFAPGSNGVNELAAGLVGEGSVATASTMVSLQAPWCLLLMRLIRERAPRACLELGTGFGISAAYQAAALELNGSGELVTMEGAADWAARAEQNLGALGLGRVRISVGAIGDSLAAEAAALAPLEFVFIDAEHQDQPTRAHFETILPALGEGALVVFDDVNWDAVGRAFDEIAGHPRVSTAIAFGRFGVIAVVAEAAEPALSAARRIAPGSILGDVGYRLRMGTARAELSRGPTASERAVASALAATSLARATGEERAWLERIDGYRRTLPAGAIAAAPDAVERPESERIAEASRATQWMSLPAVLGGLLLRLVRGLGPSSCLELGTGFGVSTAYQAAALELNRAGTITSLDIEGMLAIARPGLEGLGLGDRIELVGGLIEDSLGEVLERVAPIDFALLDADHTEDATVRTFGSLLPHLSPGAVVVLDDINWTAGMDRAWRLVRAHQRVLASIAIRRLGIVILEDPAGPCA